MSIYKKSLILLLAMSIFTVQLHAFPGAKAQSGQAQPAASSANLITGTVIETMNAANYTYLHLENNGQKQWAAIPASEVRVGDQVAIAAGMEMNNFSSKTLGRTFESIIFSQGVVNR